MAKDLEPLEVQLWIDGLSKGLRSKIRRRQQVLPVTTHESSSSEVNPLSALGDHGYARLVGSSSKERSERSAGGATGEECPLPDSLQSP